MAGEHAWSTYDNRESEDRYARNDYLLSTKFKSVPRRPRLCSSMSAIGSSPPPAACGGVDLYWIHNPADVARWTPRLIPLLKSGKVKHVGVSNHNLVEIKLADQILGEAGFRVEAIQNHYSLLYRSSEGAGILDHCRNQGIPFFAYMVLEQGALSGKYSPENPLPQGTNRAQAYNDMLPQLKALTDKLASIGRSQDAAVPDVAVAWAIAKGTTPIIGVTKASYIDGLVRASRIKLTSDEIAELEALADAANVNTRGWWEKEMQG
ncbi:aldo/keto reductase [Rhizobium binae]|nr:aldo/keto reductase [Rhizobium binae]MBX4925951.1 aldo/keto reductase [Rhizobium binae]